MVWGIQFVFCVFAGGECWDVEVCLGFCTLWMIRRAIRADRVVAEDEREVDLGLNCRRSRQIDNVAILV